MPEPSQEKRSLRPVPSNPGFEPLLAESCPGPAWEGHRENPECVSTDHCTWRRADSKGVMTQES